MNEPLHPSSLSEILDRTAQIYRSRFLVFLGIAVIPTAVLVLPAGGAALFIAWAASAKAHDGAAAGVVAALFLGGLVLIALPIFIAANALAMAAMSHASARAFLSQSITIRDSYRAVWRRGWRAIGLYLFEIVVIWIVPLTAWFILVMFSTILSLAAQSAGIGAGGLFVFAAFLVAGLATYGFWMTLRLSLAFPVAVVEQVSAWGALRRSASLTSGTKGRILLLYLLGFALNSILSVAITLPLVLLMALIPASRNPQHAQAVGTITLLVVYGASFAVQALTRPVYGIALVLFYYDQRIRQEAFDIEWMMLQAGLVVPPPSQSAEPPAAALGEPT
ncbi:MAG: glycerophosphoryl diester phosphodiesterase membrane domain-containing protein [Terracidiphilus sp.]